MPSILQNAVVRFGSLHPFASKLWIKWASYDQKENDALDEIDDDVDEVIIPDDNRGQLSASVLFA